MKPKQVGFQIDNLVLDQELVCRGLIIDKKLGNMVKVDLCCKCVASVLLMCC